jgi:outer membrane protein, heavy metal efflux system
VGIITGSQTEAFGASSFYTYFELTMSNKSWIIGLIFCSLPSLQCHANDTAVDSVRITVSSAEERFLRNNLQLLASRLNIDAATAGISQAKLWSNPNIAVEQNVHNQYTGRWFDVTRTGNTEVQIQQLFLLAGKRDKQIRLAQINAKIAEYTFYDLLRALKLELRSDVLDLYFLQQSISFYDENIKTLQKTADVVEQLYGKRSILLSDALRLKSLLFSLENERLGFVNRIAVIEGDLRVLLRDTSQLQPYYIIELDKTTLDSLRVDAVRLEDAIAVAKERRPDYKIAEANIEFETANLSLQKALGIPDITFGGRWSRAGSYIPEYYALTMSVDLPVFNRNQGNVVVSERRLEANRAIRDNVRQSVEKDVTVAYQKALDTDRLYRNFDKKFMWEYKDLIDGVVASYEKRNVSLLEFTDFYESYRTSMVQWYQLQSDRADAVEGLNYVVGANVLNPQ